MASDHPSGQWHLTVCGAAATVSGHTAFLQKAYPQPAPLHTGRMKASAFPDYDACQELKCLFNRTNMVEESLRLDYVCRQSSCPSTLDDLCQWEELGPSVMPTPLALGGVLFGSGRVRSRSVNLGLLLGFRKSLKFYANFVCIWTRGFNCCQIFKGGPDPQRLRIITLRLIQIMLC